MSTANLYNHTGKKAAKPTTLPKAVFAVKINHQLIAQAVHVFRSNQSQHNSVVQTRGDVSLTTAKVYRQKGTGNARHGAKSAPIFVGGGVAHGPKSAKPARKKLNTKMRRQSFVSALTHLAQNQAISLVADLGKISSKTKDLHNLLSQILPDPSTKTLVLINKPYPNLLQAANNINNLHITRFNHTNIHQIIKANHIIIDQEALEPLTLWLTLDKKTPLTPPSSNPSPDKSKSSKSASTK